MNNNNCPCFDSVISEARDNAVHQAYMILVDAAALGSGEKAPRVTLAHGAIAVLQAVAADQYSESERRLLIAAMAQLSKTILQIEALEYADVESHPH